jgi:hypothetical protein
MPPPAIGWLQLIEASSEGLGKGAEFVICLPELAVGQPDEPVVSPIAASSPPATRALALMRILVVDDNVDSADMIASLLRQHGHEVTVVNSGQDALHLSGDFDRRSSCSTSVCLE